MEPGWAWRNVSGCAELSLDADLRLEARREGFGFIDRLVTEWETGANRFDAPGEVFFALIGDREEMLAVGGLNRDFAFASEVGRLRRLYVREPYRGRGIGSALAAKLEEHARGTFDMIRLRTDTADAARFYASRGYEPVDSETATHVLRL